MRKSLLLLGTLTAVLLAFSGCRSLEDFGQTSAGTYPPVPPTVPPPSVTPITYDLSKRPAPLTEDQKVIVLEVALATPEAKAELDRGLSYTVEWEWGAILLEEDPGATTTIGLAGTWWGLDYDIVDTGVPSFVNPHAVIYPHVLLRFGDPTQWAVDVTVDLAASIAVRVDKCPSRKGIDLTIPPAPSR